MTTDSEDSASVGVVWRLLCRTPSVFSCKRCGYRQTRCCRSNRCASGCLASRFYFRRSCMWL